VRALVPEYEMVRARSLEEALALLSKEGVDGGWRPFAGGTDVMVMFETGKLAHRRYVSIFGLRELGGIEVTDAEVSIGAGVTYAEIRRHELLSRELPMLGMSAAETGAIAIQNRGTIGGNIANASPAADTPPVLLAYGASLELASTAGRRRVPYASFHTGYKKTLLAPGELIARVIVPRPRAGERRVEHFRKVGTRRAQAITKVGVAACVVLPSEGRPAEARIALVSVGPTTALATRTGALVTAALDARASLDAALADAARAAIAEDVTPIADVRSTAAYRLKVAQNLAAEVVEKVAAAVWAAG